MATKEELENWVKTEWVPANEELISELNDWVYNKGLESSTRIQKIRTSKPCDSLDGMFYYELTTIRFHSHLGKEAITAFKRELFKTYNGKYIPIYGWFRLSKFRHSVTFFPPDFFNSP